jgi:hypothetical protein
MQKEIDAERVELAEEADEVLQKPICPLKTLNTSANPPAARRPDRAGSR